MCLLTEWGDRTGKYLAGGHGCTEQLRDKYFPVWPDLIQSINILSYDQINRYFDMLLLRGANEIWTLLMIEKKEKNNNYQAE
jgi:hypothetical protein